MKIVVAKMKEDYYRDSKKVHVAHHRLTANKLTTKVGKVGKDVNNMNLATEVEAKSESPPLLKRRKPPSLKAAGLTVIAANKPPLPPRRKSGGSRGGRGGMRRRGGGRGGRGGQG